jgi:hypothetical protein
MVKLPSKDIVIGWSNEDILQWLRKVFNEKKNEKFSMKNSYSLL